MSEVMNKNKSSHARNKVSTIRLLLIVTSIWYFIPKKLACWRFQRNKSLDLSKGEDFLSEICQVRLWQGVPVVTAPTPTRGTSQQDVWTGRRQWRCRTPLGQVQVWSQDCLPTRQRGCTLGNGRTSLGSRQSGTYTTQKYLILTFLGDFPVQAGGKNRCHLEFFADLGPFMNAHSK